MFDFLQDAINPEQIALMKAAFEVAWQFVQADTILDSVSMSDRQAALAQAVVAVAAQGEKEVLRLANEAIGQVRKLYAPSLRRRPAQPGEAAKRSGPPSPTSSGS